MKDGGYKIIDLSGAGAFTSATEKTVAGIYDRVEETKKRIVISGLTVGNTEYKDFEILLIVSGTSFVGYLPLPSSGSISITIADDDGVTVTVA